MCTRVPPEKDACIAPRLPLLCAAVAVTLAACGRSATSPSPAPSPAAPVSISVKVPDGALAPGSQVALHATATNADGSSQDVTSQATWRSSNTDVITVSSAGIATIVAEGSAEIEASWRGVSGRTALSSRAAAFTVTGVVRDQATGNRLSGVQVDVQGQNVSAVTDVDGAFTMRGLRAGTYVLRGERRGYLPAEPSVTVSGDTTIAFALDREASPDPVPAPGPTTPPQRSGPLQLTVSLSSSVINAGEFATLSASLQNVESAPVSLTFPTGCVLIASVIDESGQVVSDPPVCTTAIRTIVLAPGETMELLNRTIRKTGTPKPPGVGFALPAGRYSVYVEMDRQNSSALNLRSAPLSVAIR